MACGFRDLLMVGTFVGSMATLYWYNEGKPAIALDLFSDKPAVAEKENSPAIDLPRFPTTDSYSATAVVDFTKPGYPVADAIYSVSDLPPEAVSEFGIPITRWGGNTATRYNWKNNAHNTGKDWFFYNRGDPIRDLSESGYLRHIKANQSVGATSYITIPMIGWVAKDHSSSSFSVSKYGKQQRTEPWNRDAGNGISVDGKAIQGNDAHDTSVEATPQFVAEAVAFVARHAGAAKDPKRQKNGVAYWVLDNEPMLWHETHADIRKKPVGYDELWERTVAYAEAIKKADPTAKVAGFCSWGWTDLFYSALDKGSDNYATQADSNAHGGVPLAEWYIYKCGEYKRKHGKALVDVFDFHWYPQGQVAGKTPYDGKGSDQRLNELRLRSTRDLWDPLYEQESWCRQAGDRKPTALIGRIHRWIDKHNPGMELAIGEYNFGGADNISGGLAQADVFGIMAREKVDLGFLWSTPEGSQRLAWKLFRNYDGKGNRFGDRFVPCESKHLDLSIYAAQRSRDGAKTVVVVNKNLGGSCDLTVELSGVKGAARAWQFDQDGQVVEIAKTDPIQNGKLRTKVPAASATLWVFE